MILQVAPDAGHVDLHLDPDLAELVGRADAGAEQQQRRSVRASRQHDEVGMDDLGRPASSRPMARVPSSTTLSTGTPPRTVRSGRVRAAAR